MTDWYNNIASLSADWQLHNVTVNSGGGFVFGPNASATLTLDEEAIGGTPEKFLLEASYTSVLDIHVLEPRAFITLDITYKGDEGTTERYWLAPQARAEAGIDTYKDSLELIPSGSAIEKMVLTMRTGEIEINNVVMNEFVMRPSIALDTDVSGQIEEKLQSLAFFMNNRSVTTTASANLLFTSLAVGYSTNLKCLIACNGHATEDTTIDLKISLDNKEILFSPIKQTVKMGYFLIGVPLTLLQITPGGHDLSFDISPSNGEVNVEKGKFQVTIEGRELKGGTPSELPHAEIVQNLPSGPLSNYTLTGTLAAPQFRTSNKYQRTDNADFAPFKNYADARLDGTVSITQVVRGDILYTKVPHPMRLAGVDLTTMVRDNSGLRFKTVYQFDQQATSLIPEGAGVKWVIDKSRLQDVEEVTINGS